MSISREKREENRRRIIELLRSTGRRGIEAVIKCMDENGYFTAHCHSHHHYHGGLAEHSLGTYKNALLYDSSLPKESVLISAIFHDMCDIHGFHHIHGHGRRSLQILQELGLEMADGERCAIANHMRLTNHSKPKRRISGSWKPVMAVPQNKRLQEAVFYADKKNAANPVRLPHMATVTYGPVTVRVHDAESGNIGESIEKSNEFKITKNFITWSLWRIVMGRKNLPNLHGGEVDMSGNAPLVGEISESQKRDFLKRVNEVTGHRFHFPSFTQWSRAMKQAAFNDLGTLCESIYYHKGTTVLAGDSTRDVAVGYLEDDRNWSRIGWRLIEEC